MPNEVVSASWVPALALSLPIGVAFAYSAWSKRGAPAGGAPAARVSARKVGKVCVEVCVDSVESAIAAEAAGADRVELCANLLEGGTTPSIGMLGQVRKRLSRALVMVMIRPRGGDFCYSPDEIEVMFRDIKEARGAGADGIVFGVLTAEGDVDVELARRLVAASRPLPVTFHRAIDMARDVPRAYAAVAALGIERVLTSGGEKSVLEGSETIRAMVEMGHENGWGTTVLIGGGITEVPPWCPGTTWVDSVVTYGYLTDTGYRRVQKNLARVLALTGATEVHVSGRVTLPSKMQYKNTGCFMGGELRPPEYSLSIVSSDRVANYIRLVSKG